MAKSVKAGSHLDSKGFKKKFPIKQHKVVFTKSAGHPLSNHGMSAKASSKGGVKGGDGVHRDERGRFS